MKLSYLARPAIRVGCALMFVGLVQIVLSSTVSAQTMASRPARLVGDVPAETSPPRANDASEADAINAASMPALEEATEIERHAFEATNVVRTKNGLEPLAWDATLCLMAREHSRNMSVLGFFSHETPEGFRLRDRARLARVRYRVIAENIAYNRGINDPGAFAVERWLISAGHRANILSPEFRGAAVGSFVAPDGTVFLTQLFILR